MEHNGTYEDRISQSYDKIFETLGKLFPSASRKNEDLFGAVVDFSLTHNEVYLEMGFLAGFQLFTELREKCQDSELMGLQLMIKKHCNERMEMEKEK